MSNQHSATFTWPPTGAHSVHVTGSFDDWSGNTHPLHRQENGWFEGKVPIDYEQKVAYKYVVDGNWMTREDEAKEWDAAGNMNNVYTAPHRPAPPVEETRAPSHVEPSALLASSAPGATTHEHSAVLPSRHEDKSVVGSSSSGGILPSEFTTGGTATTQSELVKEEHGLVGSASTDPVHSSDAKHTTPTVLESSTIDSSSPTVSATPGSTTGTTSGGIVDSAKATVDAAVAKVSSGLDNLNLGAPIGGGLAGGVLPAFGLGNGSANTANKEVVSKEVPSAADYPASTGADITRGSTSMPNAAVALAVSPEAPTTSTTTVAPASTTATEGEAHSVVESAQAIGAGLFGAVLGGLAVVATKAGEVVHSATGVDVLHVEPVSVEDAKAAGIEVDKLPQVSGPAHPPSAVLPPVPAKDFQAVPKEQFFGSVLPSTDSSSSFTTAPSQPTSTIVPLTGATSSTSPSVPKTEFSSPAVVQPKESFNESSLPNGGSASIIPSNGGTASGSVGDKAVDVFASNNQDKNEKYKTDLPAQYETAKANHSHVPQPQIKTLHESTKDRTAPSATEDAANKPISSDPGVDSRELKDRAAAEAAQVTSSGYPLPSSIPINGTGPEPSRSYIKKEATPAVSGLPLSQTQVPTSGKDAIAPSTPAKTTTPAAANSGAIAPPIAVAPVAPTTPAGKRNSVFASSPASTAPSTPAKSHLKDGSAGSSTDVRKRKSSFFAKVKSAFHKDKSA